MALFLVQALVLSCAWLPKPPDPTPTPTPEPTCEGVECPEYFACNPETIKCEPIDNCPLDEWPWCKDVNQQCSSPENPCKTNPSSDPFYCEEAIKCSEPPPPPPPNNPTPCIPEGDLVALDNRQPIYHDEVLKATRLLGPMDGKSFRERLDAAAEQVRRQIGMCVISGIEAIFIIRPDKTWEENHVAASFGGWANNGRGKYMGAHTTGPMPDGLLPDPRDYDDYAKYTLVKHNGKWDRTLKLTRVLEYCTEIGMGEMGGLPRASCPVRPEGNPYREWWEQLYGYYWECNGEEIQPTANPAQANCKGHVKTCDVKREICAEADW
jgi:hypothetical protein